MEERDGAFSYFCSRTCYEASATQSNGVTCDGCGKRFVVELVSQVIASKAGRKYACGNECREQIVRESNGARLGELIAPVAPPPGHVARATSPAAFPAPTAPTDAVPRRIAIFNHKGGTGKTTTAVSIAAALANKGKRVLLVDTDAQGNVAASLGIRCEKSLYHVLVMGLPPAEAAIPVRANLDVLGSNETLAAAELYLAGRRERDRVLRERLSSTSQLYDVVILDCSPSLSLMNQNALVFAESLLIPVACDYLSLVGVRQVLRTVKHVNQLLHHPVRIGGVIPTMYDARAKICQDSLSTLREHFGALCLPPIRATAKIKEAPANAKTIFEWAGDSNGARDYEVVVDALIRGVGVQAGADDVRVAVA
ncbi:MAG: ParA family protein [Deltaproteobacteria bacterium]|nr:ParA family protein [Deltaproteobacteria bacterium]